MSDRATLSSAASAQVDYTLYCTELDEEARAMLAKGASLTARTLRNYAAICYGAGRAERIDLDPPVAPSGICHGVRVCDLREHFRAGW
jgi:hypothetical protein